MDLIPESENKTIYEIHASRILYQIFLMVLIMHQR